MALLRQEAEAGTADDPVYHLEITAHTAVHVIQDHTLLGHVVLDDNDAIGAQALLTAAQELSQVLICQVTWGREQKCVCTCLCTLSMDPASWCLLVMLEAASVVKCEF